MQAFDAQMKKQNEMMMARRKAHRQARFEDTSNFARQLLEESEANKVLHATAEQEDKDNQGDLVSVMCITYIRVYYIHVVRAVCALGSYML